MRSEGYGLSFCPSVLSVWYHVFCHYAQQGGQKAIPTGSVPHWLDFKNSEVLRSGVKTKRTTQYGNEHGLPRPVSARFEHGGGSTRNTKGGPGLPKTLPTDVASPCVHCFREAGSCVSALHAGFSCRLYACIYNTPTNLRMRNATY